MQIVSFDMAEQQLVQARQTGDRLRGAVRSMVDAFPPSARNISGMARFLSLHKATCQRIVEGLEHAQDSLEAFARLPGVRGLSTVVEAAAQRGVDPKRLDAVRWAIAEYEQLLVTHGRTQSGLVKLIDSLRSESKSEVVVVRRGQRDRARDRRKALFDAARVITGEEVGCKSVVAIVRPSPGNPSTLTSVFAVVLQEALRHTFSRPIVPFILGGWWAKHADPTETRPSGAREEIPPYELLERFSTTGLKPVRLQDGDAKSLLVVDLHPSERHPRDPRDPSALGPADVAMLFRSSSAPNPAVDAAHRLSIAARVTNPCRALVIDAFVHPDVGVLAPARADAYSLAAPPGDLAEGAPDQCWHERFPDSAQAVVVQSSDAGPPPMYARQTELIEYLAEREGVDLSGFLHIRTQTAYPLWQSEYRLDFSQSVASGGH